MRENDLLSSEETLDPEDWESLRVLGHRMVDDVFECMKTVRERAVWRHPPDDLRTKFAEPLPLGPRPPEQVYEEFSQHVRPYPVGSDHPRFWGWVCGTGTAIDALAEFLAASMNTNTGGGEMHSAYFVEKQVLSWIKEMLGFPRDASGILTSGGSAANLVGLAVACNAKTDFDLRVEGWREARHPMVLYASQEAHSSVQKAVELIGLGSKALQLVPVNEAFQIDLEALRNQIARDRTEGRLPFCVVGAAGTTNTGAIDDLDALADVCSDEGLWFHVDGAFGAWAALAPHAKQKVAGMERADSLALDLHKWMYMPLEIGCILVRSEEAHRKAFSLTPAYLAHGGGGRGMTGGNLPWFSDYGPQLSRQFRALKAWMSLKVHGSEKYRRLIQQNVDQADYLARLVQSEPELELSAPVALNIVCFRYVKQGLDPEQVNKLNEHIVMTLQEQGVVVVSGTTVSGQYVLHVANVNHRSRREDFDILVREVIRVGRELSRDT